jgi:hypothetical protein
MPWAFKRINSASAAMVGGSGMVTDVSFALEN